MQRLRLAVLALALAANGGHAAEMQQAPAPAQGAPAQLQGAPANSAAARPAGPVVRSLPEECRSEWALSTRGIGIGGASDRVQKLADGSITVWSDFRPNSILAMFGVDPAKRKFELDGHGLAGQRTEERGGSRPETNLWQRHGDGEWVRSLNGVVDKHQHPDEPLVIDSTSFPYLLHLGLLAPDAASRRVAVVGKGKIYTATLSVKTLDSETEAYELDFGSADNQGRAFIGPDLRPVRVEFTDEHGTLLGVLRHWECR